jgi:hypothetical protein
MAGGEGGGGDQQEYEWQQGFNVLQSVKSWYLTPCHYVVVNYFRTAD